jgi:hypothetical protein
MWKGLSFLAATELGALLKRNLRAFGYYSAGALVAVIGVIFSLQAAHSWLTLRMDTISASLLIAAVMLFAAGILVIVGQFAAKRTNKSTALASSALIAAPFAARLVGRKVSYGTIVVAGVVTMGVVLGRLMARD